VPGGSLLRKQIFEAKNGGTVLTAVEAFFEQRHVVEEAQLTSV
jgi:hypothetical protein